VSTIAASERAQHGSLLATHARTVLAGSGFVMIGFLIVHLAGNLVAFAGSAAFNGYARSIRELGSPLLGEGTLLAIARVALAVTLASHLLAHAYLMLHPSDEVPDSAAYGPIPPWYATLPVSVLQVSGAVIALFLAFHIAQLTIGATHPAFTPNDPYQNMIVALSFLPVSLAYIVVALAVGLHLLPGIWTGLNSLGLIRPNTERLAGFAAPLLAATLAVGMSGVPLAVMVGILH
jgi:succinate dehydrogenase / fumarate reductase, cytochrome b subunit